MPPVRPFARHRRSGATPARVAREQRPVRPKPVITSSAISGTPCASHARAHAAHERAGVHDACPPAPCTSGSSDHARARARRARRAPRRRSARDGHARAPRKQRLERPRRTARDRRPPSRRTCRRGTPPSSATKTRALAARRACTQRWQRDLERDLDRRRAVVGEEDARQARRRDARQPLGQRDRRLVRAAREQHVVELARLRAHRLDAAAGAPWPCRHAHHDEIASITSRPSASSSTAPRAARDRAAARARSRAACTDARARARRARDELASCALAARQHRREFVVAVEPARRARAASSGSSGGSS